MYAFEVASCWRNVDKRQISRLLPLLVLPLIRLFPEALSISLVFLFLEEEEEAGGGEEESTAEEEEEEEEEGCNFSFSGSISPASFPRITKVALVVAFL